MGRRPVKPPLVVPEFKGEYRFLSNFYKHQQSFEISGRTLTFGHAEGAFQAAKHKAMNAANDQKVAYVLKVAGQSEPRNARSLGKSAHDLDVERWESIKIDVMRDILMDKFNDPGLRTKLLATGDAMLVEGNSWGDEFWGRCEGRGYNILGVILMEIRGYYRLGDQ